MKNYLVLFGLIMIMNSCFIADEYLIEEEVPEKSLQEKVEVAVENYVIARKGSAYYSHYGFSTIKIIKPLAIVELEKLENTATSDSIQQQKDIDSLKKWISDNNIHTHLKTEHFFTLRDSNELQIFETEFTLDDTLHIINTRPEIVLTLPSDREEILNYYFFEYTIFLADTYEQSKQLSQSFYRFFKNRIEELEGSTAKSKFLEHTLNLCESVKEKGQFDQQRILEKMVVDYINKERTDIEEYLPMAFSPLFEKEEQSEGQSGYYFFHKFSGTFEKESATHVVMVEFSPYYEMENVYEMDPPFDQYFK